MLQRNIRGPCNVLGLCAMEDDLRHRDRLEQFAKAYGEPLSPDHLPEGLAWHVWQPVTQRLYVWTWARRGGWLYARLHDAYGPGGIWRLPLSKQIRRAWRAIIRHLGPMGLAWGMARASLVCFGLA
jgi:hypothetical protein